MDGRRRDYEISHLCGCRGYAAIDHLLERSTLFAGQAPEAFRLHPYAKINREASKEELSLTRGTSEIAYRHGMDVAMIPGDERNFKITTRSDLERFCTIVEGETK